MPVWHQIDARLTHRRRDVAVVARGVRGPRSDRGAISGRPDGRVHRLAGRGPAGRTARAERDGGLDRRRRRCAVVADGAAQERRQRGFAFYTNLGSRKGAELRSTRSARCCSPGIHSNARSGSRAARPSWRRTRPTRTSLPTTRLQLGAWASPQSEVVPGRDSSTTATSRSRPLRRHRARAPPAALGRLSWSGRTGSSSGRAGPAGCMTGFVRPRRRVDLDHRAARALTDRGPA